MSPNSPGGEDDLGDVLGFKILATGALENQEEAVGNLDTNPIANSHTIRQCTHENAHELNYPERVMGVSESNEWRRSQLRLLLCTHGQKNARGDIIDQTKYQWDKETMGSFTQEDIARFLGLCKARGVTSVAEFIKIHSEFERRQQTSHVDSAGEGASNSDLHLAEAPPWNEDIFRLIWHFHKDGLSGIADINRLFDEQSGGDKCISDDYRFPIMSIDRTNEILAEAQRRKDADTAEGSESKKRGPYWCRECEKPLKGHSCPYVDKLRPVIRHKRRPRKKRKEKDTCKQSEASRLDEPGKASHPPSSKSDVDMLPSSHDESVSTSSSDEDGDNDRLTGGQGSSKKLKRDGTESIVESSPQDLPQPKQNIAQIESVVDAVLTGQHPVAAPIICRNPMLQDATQLEAPSDVSDMQSGLAREETIRQNEEDSADAQIPKIRMQTKMTLHPWPFKMRTE